MANKDNFRVVDELLRDIMKDVMEDVMSEETRCAVHGHGGACIYGMQAAWHKPGWDCRATLGRTRESASQRNRTKHNSFTHAISIESGIQNKLQQGLQHGSRSIGSGVQLVPSL